MRFAKIARTPRNFHDSRRLSCAHYLIGEKCAKTTLFREKICKKINHSASSLFVIGNAEAGAAATASSYANFAGNGAGIYNAASTGATTGILVLGDDSEALTGGVYYNYANADGGGVFNAGNFAISSGYILYNAVAPDDETTVYAGVRKGDTYTNSINGNGEVQFD